MSFNVETHIQRPPLAKTFTLRHFRAVINRALEQFDDDERTANLRWCVHTSTVIIWDITVDVNEEFDVVEFAEQCVETAIHELCDA